MKIYYGKKITKDDTTIDIRVEDEVRELETRDQALSRITFFVNKSLSNQYFEKDLGNEVERLIGKANSWHPFVISIRHAIIDGKISVKDLRKALSIFDVSCVCDISSEVNDFLDYLEQHTNYVASRSM